MTVERDLEKRLDEIQDMVDENRILLKKISKRLWWSSAMKIFYWVLIIGLGVVGYYATKPYLSQFSDAYEGIQGGIDSVGDIFNKEQ